MEVKILFSKRRVQNEVKKRKTMILLIMVLFIMVV